jgi:hypothetical protein
VLLWPQCIECSGSDGTTAGNAIQSSVTASTSGSRDEPLDHVGRGTAGRQVDAQPAVDAEPLRLGDVGGLDGRAPQRERSALGENAVDRGESDHAVRQQLIETQACGKSRGAARGRGQLHQHASRNMGGNGRRVGLESALDGRERNAGGIGGAGRQSRQQQENNEQREQSEEWCTGTTTAAGPHVRLQIRICRETSFTYPVACWGNGNEGGLAPPAVDIMRVTELS